MSDYRRVRVAPDLERRIHAYAIRQGRPFDNAARHLMSIGLEAINASAPRQTPATHAAEHRS